MIKLRVPTFHKMVTPLAPKARPDIVVDYDNDDDDDLLDDLLLNEKSSLQPYEFLTDSPKYLLKLCQHGNPRHVQRVCQIIGEIAMTTPTCSERTTPQQQRLLQACKWQLLRRTHMEEDMLFSFVSPRSTPLHLLVARSQEDLVRATTVQALLKAASALARHFPLDDEIHQLPCLVNKHGETPLHVACRHASQSLIRVLLAHGRSAVLVLDQQGYPPMMRLASRYEQRAGFYSQLLWCPSLESYLDDQDATSRDQQEDTLSSTSSNNNESPPTGISIHCPMYLILEMLRVAWTVETSETFSLGKAVTRFASLLPRRVVDYVLDQYLGANNINHNHTRSAKKMLQQALGQPRRRDYTVLAQQQAYFIRKLVLLLLNGEAAAESSSLFLMSSSSSTVLAQALAAGWTWNEEEVYYHHHDSIREDEDHGSLLQTLVLAHPEGLVESEDGLFPFQLAALPSTITNDMEDLAQLDTIYNLLLLAPQQIGGNHNKNKNS